MAPLVHIVVDVELPSRIEGMEKAGCCLFFLGTRKTPGLLFGVFVFFFISLLSSLFSQKQAPNPHGLTLQNASHTHGCLPFQTAAAAAAAATTIDIIIVPLYVHLRQCRSYKYDTLTLVCSASATGRDTSPCFARLCAT